MQFGALAVEGPTIDSRFCVFVLSCLIEEPDKQIDVDRSYKIVMMMMEKSKRATSVAAFQVFVCLRVSSSPNDSAADWTLRNNC